MRQPSDNLVLDANILVQMVLGKDPASRLAQFARVAETVTLITSERAVHEMRSRVRHVRAASLPLLEGALAGVLVVPSSQVPPALLRRAASFLKWGSGDGNCQTTDDHVLAVASLNGADVWSQDKDFRGTGFASWSIPNLMVALGFQEMGEPSI